MRALYIQQHGPIADLKVSDVPVPSPGADDVLVKVEASGINPSDVVSVEGKFPNAVLPRIVGRDFAGIVVKGPAELVAGKVWGSGGDLGITRDGTHTEYIVLPRQAIALRPQSLSVEEASAVGVPFITAFLATVRLGGIKEGEWIIVSGAAGAVGRAAIQIAHAKGARVIALIRDTSQRASFEAARVEAIAESNQGNLTQVVRDVTRGRGADVVLNGVGSSILESLLGSLAIGGRQITYSTVGGREFSLDLFSFYRNQYTLFGLNTQLFGANLCAGILNELTPLFESGALKPPTIGQRYSLSDASRAYDRVASRKGGKVVLAISLSREEPVEAATTTRLGRS